MKIAINDSSEEQKWSVQGRLVGEWAAELISTWEKTHHPGDTRRTIIDLIEVTSIDRNGEDVLAEMMSQGAQFISGDVYIEHLLRKLRSELAHGRMKEKRMTVAITDEVE